jgi:hypothetical protein
MALTWFRLVIPSRLSTLMKVNLAVAIVMAVLLALRGSLSPQLTALINGLLIAATVLFVIAIGPVILVQAYLYPRHCGVWYAWRTGKRRPRRESPETPAHLEHPPTREALSLRSHFQRILATKRPRTQLFEDVVPSDAPSRAAIMLNVADQLELAGKKDGARTCYRQIVERFPGSPAAHEATERLGTLAQNEQTRR